MIPKTIHYCWVGDKGKGQEVLDCIASWKSLHPDFQIKEWNELNFPLEQFPFASRMYNEKKWAFVADYVRLYALETEGGFYLDADMLLLQPLTQLIDHDCVLGEESPGVISAGMMGAVPHHPFIQACKKFYDEDSETLMTIPRALSMVYESYADKQSLVVLPPKTFYPFDSDHIKEWRGQNLGPDVIGVHLWHYSWGHPLNRFFKKIGVYALGKKIVEALGIKQTLKKILGFI